RSPSITIEQAYFEVPAGLRVRITTGPNRQRAEITSKSGHGIVRQEKTVDVGLEAARFLIDSSPYRIKKQRYLRDGWEIDFFTGPLTGLVIAEYEMESPDQEVILPPWIYSAVEVTSTVTNMHLARMAHDLSASADDHQMSDRILIDRPRIVLTGGPCSGKSSAIVQLQADMSEVLQCVPETATIIVDRVGAWPPIENVPGTHQFQRTVYRVQRGFEEVSLSKALSEGRSALLLDRGTLDGAAYLPGGLQEFERVCSTTAQIEYARYAAVIVLDVPPRDIYESKKNNSAARCASYEEAQQLGWRTQQAWSEHPNFVFIRNYATFAEKYEAIRAALKKIFT
ncbi:AAA family ATPase, partial [Patescibacteria group bacterium]|nr:AAA family ATPase [Patescibacteria group bacterium]